MSDQNKALVEAAYAAFGRGDLAAVLESMSDDIQWNSPKVENAPFTGSCTGKAAVAEFFAGLAGAEEIEVFEPIDMIAEGDRVVVVLNYRARVIATGRVTETPLIHIFTIRDGKFAAFFELYDTAAAERAYAKAATA